MTTPLQALPDIAFQNAAQYLVSSAKNDPPILIFLDGQYVFRYADEVGKIHWKLVSSTTVNAAFNHEPVDSGWLSPNIVRHGICARGKWQVRFAPATKYDLYLHSENDFLQKITVPLPSLVFIGINHTYYIWAIKELTFSPKAIIYHAPLPNIGHQGDICFGNNVVSGDIEKDWILFMQSAFNAHNVNLKSRKYPDDIRAVLYNLAAKNSRKYPLQDLQTVGAGITIDWKLHYLLKDQT